MNNSGLKTSYYNHLINDDKKSLLFNANTSALAEISSSDLPQLEKLLKSPEDADLNDSFVQGLFKGGFLIKHDQDEKEMISKRLMKARYSKEFCSLTLAPTMGCNFNCSYCFESEEVRSNYDYMDVATQKQLIHFLDKHFKRYNTKHLDICWFGGEPLLALPVIEKISAALIDICRQRNITYVASIITNGYRLTQEVARKLKKCGVVNAQVTLDGPQKIHDNRRVLKGGLGSYRKILKNIKESCEIIQVITRINVDKQNYRFLHDLLKEIETEKVKNNVTVELAYVHVDGDENKNNPAVSRKFFSDIDLAFTHLSVEYDYNQFKRPLVMTNACGGDQAYSYMVGPKGEIYQCWEDFGKPEFIVGSIFSDEKQNQAYVRQYLEFDPTKHNKCSGCTVLPLCMGGCPKHRLLHQGEPQCGIFKFNLKGYILGLAQEHKKEKNTVISQPEKLNRLFLYANLFHDSVANNYVYFFVPKRFNKGEYLRSVTEMTWPLNCADEALLSFFETFLEMKDRKSVERWKKVILQKTNLLGVGYAKATIEYFERYVIKKTIKEYLMSHHPEIINKFIEIPDDVISVSRLNIYIKSVYVYDVVQRLLYLLSERPDFFSLVNRLEVAKEGLEKNEAGSYPTIILYFEKNVLKSDIFSEFLRKIKQLLLSEPEAFDSINTEFSYQWLPCATITQGFKLYKRYLSALGLLNALYDSKANFAFTTAEPKDWLKQLEAL